MVIAESGIAGSFDVTMMMTTVPGGRPVQLAVNELPTGVVVTLTVQEIVGCGYGEAVGLVVTVAVGLGDTTELAAEAANGESARAAAAAAVANVRELRFIRQSPRSSVL
jgi:hypothetical protein